MYDPAYYDTLSGKHIKVTKARLLYIIMGRLNLKHNGDCYSLNTARLIIYLVILKNGFTQNTYISGTGTKHSVRLLRIKPFFLKNPAR